MLILCADFIAGHRRLSEVDARNKFWQIIHAVKYCHQRGIVHRDLKVGVLAFSIILPVFMQVL